MLSISSVAPSPNTHGVLVSIVPSPTSRGILHNRFFLRSRRVRPCQSFFHKENINARSSFRRDNEPLAISTEKMVPQELSQGKDCPSPWVCDQFVGNHRSNEPRRGEIFIVQRPKKRTELPRSVMTPRWAWNVRRVGVLLQRCCLYEAPVASKRPSADSPPGPVGSWSKSEGRWRAVA